MREHRESLSETWRTEPDQGSLRIRVLKTVLINVSFLALVTLEHILEQNGICEAIRGPTLLDLQDLYETTLETISFLFLVECFGSLVGSFGTGFLMNEFPRCQHTIIFIELLLLGLSTALTPFAGTLPRFFFLLFFVGMLVASVHTAGNVLCLDIWNGVDCGPQIHSIHFSYAFGAFLAPIISAPFLSTESKEALHGEQKNEEKEGHESRIDVLYPLIGIAAVLTSFGYLFFALHDLCVKPDVKESVRLLERKNERNSEELVDTNHLMTSLSDHNIRNGAVMSIEEIDNRHSNGWLAFVVVVFTLFLFLYVGIEYCFGTYLTAFAVKSELKLTRPQGAEATAIFWGCFSLMRLLAFFASLAIKPIFVLLFSFAICLFGSAATLLISETSFVALKICSGVMGFGMGTVFATGLTWLEQFIPLNTWLGSLMVIAGTLGPDLFPVLVGQVLSSRPDFLLELQFATIVACIILFAMAAFGVSKL